MPDWWDQLAVAVFTYTPLVAGVVGGIVILMNDWDDWQGGRTA